MNDPLILPGHYLDWSEENPEKRCLSIPWEASDPKMRIFTESRKKMISFDLLKTICKQPDVYGEIRKVNAGILEVDGEEQEVMDLGKNECVPTCMDPK